MRNSLRAAAAITFAACTASAQAYVYFPETGTLVINASEVGIEMVEVMDSAGVVLAFSPVTEESLEIHAAGCWADVHVTFVDGSEVQGAIDLCYARGLVVAPDSMSPIFFDDFTGVFEV